MSPMDNSASLTRAPARHDHEPRLRGLHGALAGSLAALALVACGADSGGAASASATSSAKPAATPVPTQVATATATVSAGPPPKPLASNAVVIESLKLAIEPPAGVTGDSHEMGNGVSILDFKGFDVSLTVSLAHGDMKYTKEKRAKEEGFEKWVEETDEIAIAQVKVDKAKEFYGFQITKLGESHYECGTLTKRKRTSNNEKAVRAALALCKGLRAK